jgi:alpha-ketoglutarate-dependent taurine dioxygenase
MAELDRLNADPRFALTMDLQPGDMQFLNNHVTMHSRTEYQDHPDPARRRDLIRVWLDAPDLTGPPAVG